VGRVGALKGRGLLKLPSRGSCFLDISKAVLGIVSPVTSKGEPSDVS
jgi:hypothetical protein